MYLSALSLALNRPGAVSLEQVVASLFANNEQGAWYDPSAANVTWRRNLLTYTEQFDNAAWAKTSVTVTTGQLDPNGTTTACILVGSAIYARIIQSFTYVAGSYTLSLYVAKASGTMAIAFHNTGSNEEVSYDLTTGNVLSQGLNVASATAQDAGSFWRLIATSNRSASAGNISIFAGYPSNISPRIWGAQLERGTTATAYQRIVTPEITYLADVQSQPLLFQDSTGATPVTAVEQPVGLILDKRKGLVLGSELVTNGDFATSSNWTLGSGWSISGGEATVTASGLALSQTSTAAQAGKWYQVTFTITNYTSGNVRVEFGGANGIVRSALGTYTQYLLTTSTASLVMSPTTTSTLSIDNISVKLLDGNHAYQTGSTARPVLRARYNLLTYSEQWNASPWVHTNNINAFGSGSVTNTTGTTAPDSTNTAEYVQENNASSVEHFIAYPSISYTSGVTYTHSFYAKAAERSWVWGRFSSLAFGAGYYAFFDLSGSGAVGSASINVIASIQAVGNGWFRCIMRATATSTTSGGFAFGLSTADNTLTYNGTGSSGAYFWGADLRVGTSAGDYQRIAAATDYATTSTITGQPFRPYLDADGSDDWLRLASCNLGNTWSHVGGWNCDVAGRRAFTTSDSFASAMRANGAAGSLGFITWYDTTSTMQNIATGTMLLTDSVATVERQSLTALSGRYNGGNSLSITPFDDSAQSRGLALFTENNVVANSLWDGKFYGGLWIARSLTSGERASAESYIAQKTGVTL